MTVSTVELLVSQLNAAGVEYLVVGGLAVNAHGYMRATADVDLVLNLSEANVRAALEVLARMGYRPRVPVPLAQFADPAMRDTWAKQKHMTVFSLNSDQHPTTEVDLFITDPLGFDQAFARRLEFEVSSGLFVHVCSLQDLLQMKAQANRRRDQLDIQMLKQVHGLP